MSTAYVSVDFPDDGQNFRYPPFAYGLCGLDVVVSGKLTREATGNRPRKEVRGLLGSSCGVPPDKPDKKYWLLVFDLEPDGEEKYTLTVSDEWTGEVLATVSDIAIDPKGVSETNPVVVSMPAVASPIGDPVFDAPPPPKNPLPGGFTVQVQSAIKSPDPSLSIDQMRSSSFVLQSGPLGSETFTWYYSCQVRGWSGTKATLQATQGSGNVGKLPGLTFQPGV
jgi:hypothetical protein